VAFPMRRKRAGPFRLIADSVCRLMIKKKDTWGAMVMLNYTISATGNFSVDINGDPIMTAPGNMPDIEVEYEGFKVIVEVTRSSGNKQFEMEGESIARHLGKARAKSEVPVYCLFIAPIV